MMNFGLWNGWDSYWGWHLASVFCTLILLGLILFVIWASRLKQSALKQWVIWLLVIGIIGSLLVGTMGWYGWGAGMMGLRSGGYAGMMSSISRDVKNVDNGVVITMTSSDQDIVKAMQEKMANGGMMKFRWGR